MTDQNNSNLKHLKYQLLSHLDFEKVKYEDAKTNMKKVLENICPHSLLLHLVNCLIPFLQIFYLHSNLFLSSNQISIMIITFGISFFFLKIFSSFCIEYFIDEFLKIKLLHLQINKKYYEMGDLFRKTVILSITLIVLFYFPMIYSFDSILNFFLFDQLTRERIYTYLKINFFTITFLSLNKGLYNLLYSLQRYRMINMSIFLKFIINLTFCKFFCKKNFNFFYLSGIAYSDLIAEMSMMLCLVISQYVNNPYPQVWIRLNLIIFKEMKEFVFEIFFKNLFFHTIKSIISFLIFNSWKEFLVIINIIFWFDYQDQNLILMKENLLILTFIMNLFFCNIKFTKKKGLNDIQLFFNDMCSKNEYYYLSPVRKRVPTSIIEYKNRQNLLSGIKYSNSNPNLAHLNENYEKLSIIKTQIFSCLLINFFSFLILYLLFFLKIEFFSIKINQETSDKFQFRGEIKKLFIILVLVINGGINCLCNELYLINDLLENSNCFKQLVISYLFSFLGFIYMCNYFQLNLILILVSFYFGNVFLFYKLYKYIEQADMRIITIQKMQLKDNFFEDE
jgi:hypothetical protein